MTDVRIFSIINNSGEVWPAYAIGQLDTPEKTYGIDDRIQVFPMVKPKAKSSSGPGAVYVVNGPAPVESGDEGMGVFAAHAHIVRIKEGDSIIFGDSVGPEKDEWFAALDADGWTVVGPSGDLTMTPVLWTFGNGNGDGCCEFINENDIVLSDGKESRSIYPITIEEPPGRLTTAGTARIWLDVGTYMAKYSLTGAVNADSREGWAVPYASLNNHVLATVIATGDGVTADKITAVTAKLYVVLKNLDYVGDEPKTTLHIELDATVDTSPPTPGLDLSIIIPPGPYTAGDTIYFSGSLTNTSGQALTNVTVEFSTDGGGSFTAVSPVSLAIGASTGVSFDYVSVVGEAASTVNVTWRSVGTLPSTSLTYSTLVSTGLVFT